MYLKDLLDLNTSVANLTESPISETVSFNLVHAIVRGKLHETSHSRILGEILKHDSRALRLFLEEFVENGLYIKEQPWEVLIEKDYIDILLQARDYVIIVENKVNNAPEQLNQIDNYVQKQLANSKRKIYVLYLTREYPIPPSEYSYKESKGKCDMIVKTYKNDIRNWVNSMLSLDDISFGLYSALFHYKNFLDDMFKLDCEANMIDPKIRESIEKYLDKNIDKAAALENLATQLNNVAETCKKLKYEVIWNEIQKNINTKLESKKLPVLLSYKDMHWDLPDAGLQFKLDNFENRFYAVVSYLQQSYIGIIDVNNNGKTNQQIVDKLKSILKDMNKEPACLKESNIYSTPRYPYWFKVEDSNMLVSDYIQLIDILNNNTEVKFE